MFRYINLKKKRKKKEKNTRNTHVSACIYVYGHASVSHNGHCFIRSARDAETGGKNVAAFSFNKVHRLVETVFASSPPRARRTLPPVIVSSPRSKRAPRLQATVLAGLSYGIDKRDRYEVSF